MVEHDIWEKDIDLKNTRKVVKEFKEKMGIEIKRQKKLEMVDEQGFRGGELLGKYITKMLCR